MDTFVLRIWTPADEAMIDAGPGGSRGTAHHVGTGRSGVFQSDEQLIQLLAALRRQSAEDRGSSHSISHAPKEHRQ